MKKTLLLLTVIAIGAAQSFAAGKKIVVGFSHPAYGHMAIVPEATRAALAKDFD